MRKMTRTTITGKQFDEERALYHLQHTDVTNCVFAGPADGESALKESVDVEADVRGHILSVKNPGSGRIIADSVGEIIRGGAVMECTGEVICRTELLRNMADAGCEEDTATGVLTCLKQGKKKDGILLLQEQRDALLDGIHKDQSCIGFLDEVLGGMRKECM